MTPDDPRDDATLVALILDRFHEGHRRDLPPLQAAARAAAPALADHLDGMARALESHMFKEEMRLFPMIEQGGHALAGLLIEDLEAEHRAHELSVMTLELLMDSGPPLPGPLRQGLAHFIAELKAHVAIEDEVLFARHAGAGLARPVL